MPEYALSLKQPWAALLVHGRKAVEVRAWPTARRGRILIHAARVSDPRAEAWDLVPEELRETARLVGGLVGAAELTGCRAYRSVAEFTADRHLHLNDPAWFRPPVLYGFAFARAVVLPFRKLPGWMRFFPVPADRVDGT
jgi:ASCH domain